MTATQSPRELLATYRQTARQAAAENGGPGNRSEFPGLPLEATGMIYVSGKDVIYRGLASEAAPVDPARLEAILTQENSSVVVADNMTYSRLMALADETGECFKTLSRRLSFSRGLAASIKLPILTNAVSYRTGFPKAWTNAASVTGPRPSTSPAPNGQVCLYASSDPFFPT